MKYYIVLYDIINYTGGSTLLIVDWEEFATLKKARRFMRKCYKETLAKDYCEWLESNHSSFGVYDEWVIRIERGTRIHGAMPIK